MKAVQPLKFRLLTAAACVLLLPACSGGPTEAGGAPNGGLSTAKQHAMFDRDSRNNEDPDLGVKPLHAAEQHEAGLKSEHEGPTQLDMTNRHAARAMAFAPQLERQIEALPGIQSAVVLVTEMNAYVSVVMDGHDLDREAHAEMMQHQITPQGGTGLFADPKGPGRFSWTDEGDLPQSTANEIRNLVLSAGPKNIKNVYSSGNPNFHQRLRFYAKEERERGNFTDYVSEFNTMVQHVFPDDVNTRK